MSSIKITTTITEDIPIHELINKYKKQLSNQEKLVLDIAISHLETSFDISKSIGFVNWKKQQNM
mgnify:CR=1 FL=1|jgi:hypothetical protein